MLNLLSPDILRICTDMIIQIILPGYSIVGYLAYMYMLKESCIQGIYQKLVLGIYPDSGYSTYLNL